MNGRGARKQNGHGGVNAVRQSAEIVADEDDALLAHERAEQENQALHVEAGHERGQLHIDQRSIHVLRAHELVFADVERLVRLGKSSLAALMHEVHNPIRLKTRHGLRHLQEVREDGEVRSRVNARERQNLLVT